MHDPTTLPYLRAVVCFLDERLSKLLPREPGRIEFGVSEQFIPCLANRELDTTWVKWIEWIEFDAKEPVPTILRWFPSLQVVLKLMRFANSQAGVRADRGGPFEAFQLLMERGFVAQPWLRSARVSVGHLWEDRIRDANGEVIRDSDYNSIIKCWLEVESYPARLMNHLSELAREMETIGELRRRGLLKEFGIDDPSSIDWESIETSIRNETETSETVDEAVQQHTPRVFERCIALPRALPDHIQTYVDALKSGKRPAEAAEIANKQHQKYLLRKTYTDILRRHTKTSRSQKSAA